MKKLLILLLLLNQISFGQKWTKLFDGKTTAGWHNYNKTTVNGWTVVDGVLLTEGKSGNLTTDKEYENFELRFEFKASRMGNSGILYKVIERLNLLEPYLSGPEYQIIDDIAYPENLTDYQKTGANYGINPPNDLTVVKPAETWNKGKIIVKNNHIEHWLNDKKIAAYDYATDEWALAVSKSKFAKWEYAKAHAKGKICLQDHGDAVAFRNIKIKEFE